MLITRTPLRISIGGGGTDLPSYYERRGGFFISAAIGKYMFIAINRTFTRDYLLKYSALERRASVEEIDHRIVRAVLSEHRVEPGVEIVSTADIPAGAGLGSSGAFTVGLLRALYAIRREHVSPGALAEEAARIEIETLGEPVGKQDQYIAAFGGLTCFEVATDGRVSVSPLGVSNETLHELEERLLLFFTGYSRSAGEILADQDQRSRSDEAEVLDGLDRTKELGREIKRALERGEPQRFGELMGEHWNAKRERSAGISNPEIDRWYETGVQNGAVGGKLVGAGKGGFLMFYADDPPGLRTAMKAQGLPETRFAFDFDGSTVLVRD
ncbi:MAG: galactokinase [Solirubrobacterales bacterium]|nr:galactokinase [Solirubrobacterales bacterium]